MRRLKNVVFVLLAVALVAGIAAGCAQPTPTPKPAPTQAAQPTTAPATEVSPTATPAEKPKVAMILQGLISDGGWNAAGYASLMQAEQELNLDVTYLENVSVADVEAALRDFADQGYDLIMAHGNQYIDVVLKVAEDYPDVYFAVSQGRKYAKNVSSYSSSVQDASYLTGMLGAYVSKTGKLGFTSGMKIPSQIAALNAYTDGARSVNPDIEVIASFPGVWNDTEKGRQAALAQIDAGVDFIMPRGDGIALGGIQAAKERGIYAVGSSADQWDLAPGVIITSNIYSFVPYIKYYLDLIAKGEFDGTQGEVVFGLKEGATGLSDYHGLVPDDVAQKIQETIDKIKSGELVIPEDTTDRG